MTGQPIGVGPPNPVSVFAPWSTQGQHAQRLRLYKARDIAGARAARSQGWTAEVFRGAEQIASDWIWSRASEDELRAVANVVLRLFQAGAALEQVESGNA
jgi:hypothetical protein